jgi:3-phenylpropionate/cinnamic acid dioxygenase small subunit
MTTAADPALLAEVSDLLYREGAALDELRYDDWLALFTEDCEFWVPAWKGDHTPTDNPKREVSLIYYSTRAGLEDRVWRIRSGQSVASRPVPRTTHLVGSIRIEDTNGDVVQVSASWQAFSFFHKTKATEPFFGRYFYELVRLGGELRIKRKKVILMNDYIPTMLDVYNI